MSGETQNVEKPRDRFDLEQEILECWRVTDDINLFVGSSASADELRALSIYYNRKFERLWETFEHLCSKM